MRQLPDLISPTNLAGLIRDLDKTGKFLHVSSERLTVQSDNASCQDFSMRFVLLVRGSFHESNGRKAVELLLRPGPEIELTGPQIAATARRDEAEDTARRAVSAFLSGDAQELKAVASRRSSQLAECTRPVRFMQGIRAQAGAVELRGNDRLAVGLVESTFEGDRFLGGDPIAVVLVRESGQWKALSICRDVVTVKDTVPALCDMMARMDGSTSDPPDPRLVEPLEGQNVGEQQPYLSWTIGSGGGVLLGQILAFQYGDLAEKDASWPDARLQVFPAELRQGKVPALGGIVGAHMSWSVWTIGCGGQVAVAPAAHYGVAPAKIK